MYKRGNSFYSDFWYEGQRFRKSWGPVTRSTAKEKEGSWKRDIRSALVSCDNGGGFSELNLSIYHRSAKNFLRTTFGLVLLIRYLAFRTNAVLLIK